MNTKNIIIAGAGVMGSSIAQVFTKYNYDVTLYVRREKSIEKSKNLIKLNQQSLLEEKELTEEESQNIIDHISFTTDKNCFKNASFVIESITEKMDSKQTFWKEVSKLVPDSAILTTNTSGLSITEIAVAVNKPERFCGMHWINPPHIIPLIEVIKGEKTSDSTTDAVYELALDIGKKPVMLKKEIQGFLLNRFQFAILREAMHIVDKGIATKEDVDNVFKYGLGMRYACLGPFEIADLGGLDTFYSIASYLFEDLSNAKDVSPLLAEPFTNGNYGVKNGKGFYDYSNGKDTEAIEKRDRDFLRISKFLYSNK